MTRNAWGKEIKPSSYYKPHSFLSSPALTNGSSMRLMA
jgi:hypothetical protein